MSRTEAKGVVVAGHQETVDAGATILRQGGNAVDAALAAAFASFTAEPVLTSLFGGGLLAVQTPDGQGSILDFFAHVPGLGGAGPTEGMDFESVLVNFGPTVQEFIIGRGAAAVPGTLHGLLEAHRLWASLPLEALVEPAVDLARRGARLTPQMAFIFEILEPILLLNAGTRELFAPNGTLLEAGELYRSPDLADLLHRLAREGAGGPTVKGVEEAVISTFGADTGLFTQRDLAESRPVLRKAATVRYHGVEVMLPPAPVLGGALVALGLELLQDMPAREHAAPEAIRWMAEVQRRMTVARSASSGAYLDGSALAEHKQAMDAALTGITAQGSTTHISVLDASGMAASVTNSNGEGCGYVVPGTGLMMNNFLGEADINPNGFHKQAAGERMMTMMCPSVIRHGETTWVLGTGGSNRIRTAMMQVINNLVALSLSPSEAVGAPRIHIEGDVMNVETTSYHRAVTDAEVPGVTESVLFEEPNMFFGGVHVAELTERGFDGAGDDRRGGELVVV